MTATKSASSKRRARAIASNVETWFAGHARDLPWRRRRTGYTGLVSEAMLQQTQVSRVVESYRAFMRSFPTVKALAAADEQDVMAAWNGLGYYRRARNLHAAARQIVDEYSGRVPRDADALLSLPGVGRYTAGAIASIVFGRVEPIVDGNVQRVLARLECDERPTDERDAKIDAWRRAGALVEASGDPGAFNEGLMELGATVCTPKSPRCSACPLLPHCRAHLARRVECTPPPKQRDARRTIHHHAVVVTRGDRVLLEQRPASGMWAHMWQPPTVESDRMLDEHAVRAALPHSLRSMELVSEFTHLTTHRRVLFHVHRGTTLMRRGEWVSTGLLDGYSISNAHRRAIRIAAAS